MPILFASLTDPLVEFAVDVVDAMGLPGIFLLMVAESACIPIPSEATFLFAGFNVARGRVLDVRGRRRRLVANVVGSWIAYAVGYFGRIDILEKHGSKLHIKPSHLAWADRWFERYGDATVFFSRMLPIIRTFISLPAGVARMPFWRFTLFTTLGCVPWMFMLTFIGKQVGDNWETWKDNLHYVDYAVAAAIVIAAIYFYVRRRRRRATRCRRRRAGRRCRPLAETVAPGCCRARPSCCRSPPPRTSGCVLPVAPRRAAGAARKEIEVALHAGTAMALALARRAGSAWRFLAAATLAAGARRPGASSASWRSASAAPRTVAAGLVAGARRDGGRRPHAGATGGRRRGRRGRGSGSRRRWR